MSNIAYEDRFVKLPILFIQNGWLACLRLEEINVFLSILRFYNVRLGIAFPSLKRISQDSGVSRRYVRYVIDRLIFFALIRILRRKNYPHTRYNIYHLPLKFPKITKEDLQPLRNAAWAMRKSRQETWKLKRQGMSREQIQAFVDKDKAIQAALTNIYGKMKPKDPQNDGGDIVSPLNGGDIR